MMRAYWDCVEAFMGPGHLEWRKEIDKMAYKNADLDARYYIEDESIGGIEREYVEVERKATVGDYVLGKKGHIRKVTDFYDFEGGCVSVVSIETGECCGIYSHDFYVVLESTDIVRIDNVRYRLVDRKAEVGDKVIVSETDGDAEVGMILDVHFVYVDGSGVRTFDVGGERYPLSHESYRVLESMKPVEPTEPIEPIDPITVDETQASPEVIDMLAHIAKELAKINRRLDKAEEHIGDTKRNVETFAQQTEANTERIKKLESASDLESGRVRKIDFDKDMLMRDIGSLNKRLEAFINDAR